MEQRPTTSNQNQSPNRQDPYPNNNQPSPCCLNYSTIPTHSNPSWMPYSQSYPYPYTYTQPTYPTQHYGYSSYPITLPYYTPPQQLSSAHQISPDRSNQLRIHSLDLPSPQSKGCFPSPSASLKGYTLEGMVNSQNQNQQKQQQPQERQEKQKQTEKRQEGKNHEEQKEGDQQQEEQKQEDRKQEEHKEGEQEDQKQEDHQEKKQQQQEQQQHDQLESEQRQSKYDGLISQATTNLNETIEATASKSDTIAPSTGSQHILSPPNSPMPRQLQRVQAQQIVVTGDRHLDVESNLVAANDLGKQPSAFMGGSLVSDMPSSETLSNFNASSLGSTTPTAAITATAEAGTAAPASAHNTSAATTETDETDKTATSTSVETATSSTTTSEIPSTASTAILPESETTAAATTTTSAITGTPTMAKTAETDEIATATSTVKENVLGIESSLRPSFSQPCAVTSTNSDSNFVQTQPLQSYQHPQSSEINRLLKEIQQLKQLKYQPKEHPVLTQTQHQNPEIRALHAEIQQIRQNSNLQTRKPGSSKKFISPTSAHKISFTCRLHAGTTYYQCDLCSNLYKSQQKWEAHKCWVMYKPGKRDTSSDFARSDARTLHQKRQTDRDKHFRSSKKLKLIQTAIESAAAKIRKQADDLKPVSPPPTGSPTPPVAECTNDNPVGDIDVADQDLLGSVSNETLGNSSTAPFKGGRGRPRGSVSGPPRGVTSESGETKKRKAHESAAAKIREQFERLKSLSPPPTGSPTPPFAEYTNDNPVGDIDVAGQDWSDVVSNETLGNSTSAPVVKRGRGRPRGSVKGRARGRTSPSDETREGPGLTSKKSAKAPAQRDLRRSETNSKSRGIEKKHSGRVHPKRLRNPKLSQNSADFATIKPTSPEVLGTENCSLTQRGTATRKRSRATYDDDDGYSLTNADESAPGGYEFAKDEYAIKPWLSDSEDETGRREIIISDDEDYSINPWLSDGSRETRNHYYRRRS